MFLFCLFAFIGSVEIVFFLSLLRQNKTSALQKTGIACLELHALQNLLKWEKVVLVSR